MKRLLILALLAVAVALAMSLAFALLPAQGNAPTTQATTPVPVAAKTDVGTDSVKQLINQQRESAGLPALVSNPELDTSACLKADDMLAKDYWSHEAPDGTTPWHFFDLAHYDFSAAGENLAYDYMTDAALVEAWMNSPTHRDNILGDFNEQGLCVRVGDFQGKRGTALVVSHFGTEAL